MIAHLFIVGVNKYTLMFNEDIKAAEELIGEKSLNLITMKLNDLAASFGITVLVYGQNAGGAWEQQRMVGIRKGEKLYNIDWL